jgi:hypothetical protein
MTIAVAATGLAFVLVDATAVDGLTVEATKEEEETAEEITEAWEDEAMVLAVVGSSYESSG